MRLQIVRDVQIASLESARKVLHVPLANLARLHAERRKRMFGISGVPQQSAQEFPVRPEVFELDVDNRTQARFQIDFSSQRGFDLLVHGLAGLTVESHYQGFFGIEIVVRGADGNLRRARNVAHGSLIKTTLTKQSQRR